MILLLRLFISFFGIGIVSIGGGLSIIPLLTDVMINNGWMTQAEIIDMIAISEMTPGPIGINMATYAGYQTAGVLGGLFATLGTVTPSIIIIVIIAHLYDKFKNSEYVMGTMKTIRPIVTGMIAAVCVSIAISSLFNVELYMQTNRLIDLFTISSIIIAVLVFVAGYKFKVHPVILVIVSAIVGIVIL